MSSLLWMIFLMIPKFGFSAEKILFLDSALKSEIQSEEGILLIQCLTGDGSYTWQIRTKEDSPVLRLESLAEDGIVATLTTKSESIKRQVREGELLSHCEEFRHALDAQKNISIAPIPKEIPAIPTTMEIEEKKSSALPWILGGACAAIGAYFLWKSHQPDFRKIEVGTR